MKINYVCFFLLLIISNAMAQDFQGVATYKSHTKLNINLGGENDNSEAQKRIQEQLKKQFEQEYTLTFNKHESIYKQEEKLDAPNPSHGGMTIMMGNSSNILYKNIKDNRFSNKTDIYGKPFLVKDTLTSIQWVLENETKNIGNYTCFKATYTSEHVAPILTEQGTVETQTTEIITTVWYTPEIPVSNGPNYLYGLPGLILEVNDGQTTLVCSKVVINPTESVEIIEPTKGKVVAQDEYMKIMDDKSKEMMEQFKNGRGHSDGETRVIRIGG